MAAKGVVLSGMLYDLFNRTTQRVVFMGQAGIPGLGMWEDPGGFNPDAPGQPWPPDPPVDPPIIPPDTPPGTVVKPPPSDGGWGFVTPYGWAYFPGEGEAGPKGKK